MAKKIRWSSLLNIDELEFIPSPPTEFTVSDEIIQTIAWLTAATSHDRRLLRCTELGALLTGHGWDNLTVVENDELYPGPGSPDSFTFTASNKGILVASSTLIIKAGFVRVSGGAAEDIYVPPGVLYFYPHSCYSITARAVPTGSGTASYVGITAFN